MRITAKTTTMLWAAAGVAWVANGALGLDAADNSGGFYVSESVWLGVHTLVLLGLVGLGRLGVIGDSPWGKAGLRLAIVGRILFLSAEAVSIVVGHDDVPLLPLAAVSTALGMLGVGGAVIGAGRLAGWQRYLPLAMGAYPFVLMFPVVALTGERPDLAVTGWGLTLVGVAVASRAAAMQQPGRANRVGTPDRSSAPGSAHIPA